MQLASAPHRSSVFSALCIFLAVAICVSCTSPAASPEKPLRSVNQAVSTRPNTLPPGGLVSSTPGFGWTSGKFTVTPDGAASYNLPLWTPLGRGVVTPRLSLSYNSRAGNGILGVGWSIGGLSIISWCKRTIAQDGYTGGGNFAGAGALCLDGNRLVPTSPESRPEREFRTEQEIFARVIAYGMQDNVPDFFKVWSKDGKILTFGGTTDARVQPYRLKASDNMAEPSLVRSGAFRETTAWALDRTEDRNGNVATVSYTRTEGSADELWWIQLQPDQIAYSPNRTIKFHYDHDRPDKMHAFAGGTYTRTAARVSRIEMWGGPEGGDAELLRQYRMRFQNPSITERSLLRSITECDRDTNCKQPLPFTYSMGSYNFEHIDVDPISNPEDPCWQYGCEPFSIMVLDANGDGRNDLLNLKGRERSNEVRTSHRGIDGDTFSRPGPLGLTGLGTFELVDVDADGRPEVLAEQCDDSARWYSLYTPSKSPAGGSTFEAVPGRIGEQMGPRCALPGMYHPDLDGNGLPDVVQPDGCFYQLNNGDTGSRFGPKVNVRCGAFFNIPVDINGDGRMELIGHHNVAGAFDRGWVGWGIDRHGNVRQHLVNLRGGGWKETFFGDVNGDGLADAVRPNDSNELRVQINSGAGFGSRHTTPSPAGYGAPNFTRSDVDHGIRLVDFNGDGSDDVLFLSSGTLYVWNDNEFVRVKLNLDLSNYRPNGPSWDNTQVLDLDGDGALDIVNVRPDGRLQAFQRLGGVPDLMTGVGSSTSDGRTEISYTNAHTTGTCAYPLTCTINAGMVVASHRILTNTGPQTAGAVWGTTWDSYTHTYAGARIDLSGRGWLGFEQHAIRRTATGATTQTEFDNQYRDPSTKSYPFALLPKRETYTVRNSNDGSGREFRSIAVNDYELRRLSGGTYTVVHRTSTMDEEERPVGSAEWRSLRHGTTAADYDDFGSPNLTRSATTGGRTLTRKIEYRNDPAAWLLGLPTRTIDTACTSNGECAIRETTFDYDPNGNKTATVVQPSDQALKLAMTTEYGQFGITKSVTKTDAAGHSRIEKLEYDADGLHPTAKINAIGQRSLTETHSGLGVPISTTDPNEIKTTFRHDRFGRLRETNHSNGSFERVTHSLNRRPIAWYLAETWQATTTATPRGTTEELADQMGRVRERRVTALLGSVATTFTEYDPLGRGVSRTSLPLEPGGTPQYTVTSYDNRGRVTSITAPDETRIRHEYINLESHTYDAKNTHSSSVATPDGEVGVQSEEDPNSTDGVTTRFEYGPFGEKTKTIAPDDTSQTMHYDSLGRLIRLEDLSSGTTKTMYNAFGEVVSQTDAENRTITLEYDTLGRVKKETSADGVATNTWDTADHGLGKLARASSADGTTIDYAYDEWGRDSMAAWTIEGTRYEFGYGFDEVGRPSCLSYPAIPGTNGQGDIERLSVGSVYNAQGYLTQVKAGCGAEGHVYWAAEARNGSGQIERERYGNSVVTTLTYRPTNGLLDRIQTTAPGAPQLADISYDYDKNLNVIKRNDQVNQRAEFYHHDSLNRLDSWSVQHDSGPPVISASYSYTRNGDLKTETVNSPNQPEKTTTYRYGEHGAGAHWLTSRNDEKYEYNRNGQQTKGQGRALQYNAYGLPTALDLSSGPSQVRHTKLAYDPHGTRVVKRDEDQITVTVAGLFERRTPTGTGPGQIQNLHNIIVDGRIVAQVNRSQERSGILSPQNQVTYLHTDLQGTIIVLTNQEGKPAGAEGSSLPVTFYDPFGQRINAQNAPVDDSRLDGPRQGYTGHEHDDELGLINMRGRIYDPEVRRFLTPDPIHASKSSQSLNRYSYVVNNPSTLIDPTGHLPRPPNHFPEINNALELMRARANECPPDPEWCNIIKGFSTTPTEDSFGSSADADPAQADPGPTLTEQRAVFAGDEDGKDGEDGSTPEPPSALDVIASLIKLAAEAKLGGVFVKGLDVALDLVGHIGALAEGPDELSGGVLGVLGGVFSAVKWAGDLAQGTTALVTLLKWSKPGWTLSMALEATKLALPRAILLSEIGAVLGVVAVAAWAGYKARLWVDDGGPQKVIQQIDTNISNVRQEVLRGMDQGWSWRQWQYRF
jgi:RHS repeat-associated protein